MRLSPLEERITKIIEPVVTGMGFDLYCVQQAGGDASGMIIQVMAENPKTRVLSVAECSALSRAVGAIMDVEDPIQGAYRLEVSSPGIDRLLMKLSDYEEYKGFEIKAEIDPPIEGQKRFRGRITGIENNETVLLKVDNGDAALPFDRIQKAKLVMTDELLKATQKKFKLLTADSNKEAEKEVEDHGTAASR